MDFEGTSCTFATWFNHSVNSNLKSMTEQQKETEAIILEAARRVFISKGLDGARMQEIADEAGINKALLHYYFRSKDKLFEMIFREEIGKFLPGMLMTVIADDIPFDEKLRLIVKNYITLFLDNPFLPAFIIREINRNPERIKEFFEKSGFKPEAIQLVIRALSVQLAIPPEQVRHLIVNIISLCVFPFAGRPVAERILFNENTWEYDRFLEERKENVASFVLNAIRNSK